MGDFFVLFATGIPLGLSRKKDKKKIVPPAINSIYKPCLEENQTETSGKFTNFGKHRKRNKINLARIIDAKRSV